MLDMTCKIAGVTFKNPIVMASGTFGFGKEYAQFYDLSMLGGIALKGLTLQPRCGNSGTRIYETPSGLLNSVGLENPGIKAFLEYDLDELGLLNTVLITNLGGGTLEEYVLGAKLLTDNENKRRALGLR
ncbi:hypothetical protein B1222_06840 [Paenibacillus larvae subsp. pulvifaciens]|nr:hypothetical protein B1222_06840 [Paenibacillus larvae subsp. pulvifaciens]